MSEDSSGLRGQLSGTVVVFAILGLLVGAAAAPHAWGAVTASDGTVAVIEMHGTITTDTATTAIDDLREARQNSSIQAVALDIDSPGGTAAASEQLYLAVKRTQQELPVVVSVTGTAASGGYYMAAPADDIYVSPASSIGSVGVRATVPTAGVPAGEITTGPDKGSMSTESEVRNRVEALRRAFVGSVVAERNESLELTAEELSYAKLYSGARGVELGLADEIGGIDTAVAAAASQAGLSDYETTRMESPQASLIGQLGLQASDGSQSDTDETFSYRGVDTVQYLMLHGQLEPPETAADQEVTTDEQ